MIDIYIVGVILVVFILFMGYWLYQQYTHRLAIRTVVVSKTFDEDYTVTVEKNIYGPGIPDLVQLFQYIFYTYLIIIFLDVWDGATPSDILDEFFDMVLIFCGLLAVVHGIEILWGYLKFADELGKKI